MIKTKNDTRIRDVMRSLCFRTPKQEAEKTLVLAKKLELINRNLEIQRDEEFIFIPLAKLPPAGAHARRPES